MLRPISKERIFVISGLREPHPEDVSKVEIAVVDFVRRLRSTEVRLGGARGVDTIALLALRAAEVPARLVVYLPATRADAPAEARASLHLADEVIELGGDPRQTRSYLIRNERMLLGGPEPKTDFLLAFRPPMEDDSRGGTAHAIRTAQKADIQFWLVPVRRAP